MWATCPVLCVGKQSQHHYSLGGNVPHMSGSARELKSEGGGSGSLSLGDSLAQRVTFVIEVAHRPLNTRPAALGQGMGRAGCGPCALRARTLGARLCPPLWHLALRQQRRQQRASSYACECGVQPGNAVCRPRACELSARLPAPPPLQDKLWTLHTVLPCLQRRVGPTAASQTLMRTVFAKH